MNCAFAVFRYLLSDECDVWSGKIAAMTKDKIEIGFWTNWEFK
jgi:hypothetical protein